METNLLSMKEFNVLTIIGHYGNERVWHTGIKPNEIIDADVSGEPLREEEIVSLASSLKERGLVESHDSNPNSFLIVNKGVKLIIAYRTLISQKHIVYH